MMESSGQRFSVISRASNSKTEGRTPLTPHQPISVIKQPSNIWVNSVKRRKHPKHIIVLEGEPVMYKCTICSTIFKSKSNCCYHKHCGDEGEKPFKCSICDRKFSTKTHFSYHILMHSGLNPHKCSICGKSFKTKYKLRRHQQVHTDTQKRFFCEICGRAFLRKSSVHVHKHVHTGVQPYQCNECSKAFREKKNLIFHLSRHTGIKNFVCEICGKSYALKRDLELHKRTHSRIRPFSCTVMKCQQTFSQRRYLKRHMETHESCVRFICSICDKEFSRKDNLQRHIVNTHLESQNSDVSRVEKTKHTLLDTAPYIKTIKTRDATNESDKLVSIEREVPLVRTESVIMSISNTHSVICVSSKQAENNCNHVSVIRTLTDISPEADKENDSEDLNHNDHTKFFDYQAQEVLPEKESSTYPQFESPKAGPRRDRSIDERFGDDEDQSSSLCSSSLSYELNYEDIRNENFISQPVCGHMNNESNSIHFEPNTRLHIDSDLPYDDENCCPVESVISSRYVVHNSRSVCDLNSVNRESTHSFCDTNENVYRSMNLQSLDLANHPVELCPSFERNVYVNEDQQLVRYVDREDSEDTISNKGQWIAHDDIGGGYSLTEKLIELKYRKEVRNRDSPSFGEISPAIDINRNRFLGNKKSGVLQADYKSANPSSQHEIVHTEPHFDFSNYLRVENIEQEERSRCSTLHNLANCLGAGPNSFSKSAKNDCMYSNEGSCAYSSSIRSLVGGNNVSSVTSHVVPHFAPERITSEIMKTRCMLPKKVIAASYKNSSAHEIFNTRTGELGTNKDYKLLDLSMKSQ